jgi:large subunit ribosomal protein L20
MRSLSIVRVNAGVKQHGIKYSQFIHNMNTADIQLSRKVLANLAATEPYSFQSVVIVSGTESPPTIF